MRNNQPVTQHEQHYPAEQALISTTDLQSRITDANDHFCAIAGFSREELLGQPHNPTVHTFFDLMSSVGKQDKVKG